MATVDTNTPDIEVSNNKYKKLERSKQKLPVDISIYFVIVLCVLAVLGFWPSYFAKFFNGTANFTFYLHFHATLMMLWISMLIIQPILVRKKNLQAHRLVGKSSYILFPMMCMSIILTIHQSASIDEAALGNRLLFLSKNLFIFILGYAIAIKYRHNIDVHARGMIVTGIALIEPALTRLMLNLFASFELFVTSPDFFFYGSIPTILIIFSFLIGMMFIERHQARGRWVFPLTLILYSILYGLWISQIHLSLWDSLSKWFVSLPLTQLK